MSKNLTHINTRHINVTQRIRVAGGRDEAEFNWCADYFSDITQREIVNTPLVEIVRKVTQYLILVTVENGQCRKTVSHFWRKMATAYTVEFITNNIDRIGNVITTLVNLSSQHHKYMLII